MKKKFVYTAALAMMLTGCIKNEMPDYSEIQKQQIKENVQKVALLGGGGKDFVESAIAAGADVLITGEVTYNVMLEAKAAGIGLITAGHYHTERPVLSALGELIKAKFPETEVEEYPLDTEIFSVR